MIKEQRKPPYFTLVNYNHISTAYVLNVLWELSTACTIQVEREDDTIDKHTMDQIGSLLWGTVRQVMTLEKYAAIVQERDKQ
jgi:hypothetical protein